MIPFLKADVLSCSSGSRGSSGSFGSEKSKSVLSFNGFEAKNTYTNYCSTKYEKQVTV